MSYPRAIPLLLATTLALGACSGSEPAPSATATSPDAPVIQPGTPGEPNTSLTGTSAVATPSDSHNAADAAFLKDMIRHHAQAVIMNDLVKGDLKNEKVQGMASRIKAEQKPEMEGMGRTLKSWGEKAPPQAKNPTFGMNEGHSHGHGMPGMATKDELDRLDEAKGTDADRLYLDLMIKHHKGAVEMCNTLGEKGKDVRTEELCDEITVAQKKQISQMKTMRRNL